MSINTMEFLRPASFWGARWRDALPLGNGLVGAAVYGSVGDETVMITRSDLWTGGLTQPLPDVSDFLVETRRLLQENNAVEADAVISSALKEAGYSPRMSTPLPLGDLRIRTNQTDHFKHYRRRLHLDRGEAVVQWDSGTSTFRRRCFVCRASDTLAMEMTVDGPVALDVVVRFEPHDPNDARDPFGGDPAPLPVNCEVSRLDGWIRYAATNDDGRDFGAVVRVEFGRSEQHQSRCIVLVKTFVGEERRSAWDRLVNELSVEDCDYELRLATHAKLHKGLFERATISLAGDEDQSPVDMLLVRAYEERAPIALIEKMWAYGRHLLISASRPGGQPCPLMGLWCGEYRGLWSFHMANENLQMIYWQALAGALEGLLDPLFDFIEARIADFRVNAMNLYGCRGIYIPAPMTPDSGLIKDLQPHIIHWTGAAGWIAQVFFDTYLYTCDRIFLETRALPFMREAAMFYMDFLIEQDGELVFSPSVSPENTPGNAMLTDGRSYVETTINATMDVAIARELMSNLVAAESLVGGNSEPWKQILERLPKYGVNPDGGVREWQHGFFEDNDHHRHLSHLYPVFPGLEITADSDPDLFRAFRVALDKRCAVGLADQSGWSSAHMANVYARFGEGDLALGCLDRLIQSCVLPNLTTLHNDWRGMGIGLDMPWAPLQIDANMGWTAAVQEMLLQSSPGHITLFPAVPTTWPRPCFRGLIAMGAIEVSAEWERAAGRLTLECLATNDRDLKVSLPDRSECNVHLVAHSACRFEFRLNDCESNMESDEAR